MKSIGTLLFFFITWNIYLQNPFVDGIQTAKTVEFNDGGNKYTMFGFKINLPDDYTVNYTFTQYIATRNSNFSYIISTSWKWKDIATIEKDTIINTLLLNGKGCITTSKQDMDTKEVTVDACYDVATIYYKDKISLKAAAKWTFDYITKLGGKVMLIN